MEKIVTRRVKRCIAYFWSVDAKDSETAMAKKTGNVEFVATTPNKQLAYKALKAEGVKCQRKDALFDVICEETYAMPLSQFMSIANKIK